METEEQILQAMQKVYEDHHMSVVQVLKYNLEDMLEVGTGFIIKSREVCICDDMPTCRRTR